jgi:hypothetical protein
MKITRLKRKPIGFWQEKNDTLKINWVNMCVTFNLGLVKNEPPCPKTLG